MDRIEDLLRGASREEIAYLARKAAAVLAALPAAHAELGRNDRGVLPAVVQVVRLLGALETVVLNLSHRDPTNREWPAGCESRRTIAPRPDPRDSSVGGRETYA